MDHTGAEASFLVSTPIAMPLIPYVMTWRLQSLAHIFIIYLETNK